MRKRGQPYSEEQIKLVHALGENATVKRIDEFCASSGIGRDFIKRELVRAFPIRASNRYQRAELGNKKSREVAKQFLRFKELSVEQFEARYGKYIYSPHEIRFKKRDSSTVLWSGSI